MEPVGISFWEFHGFIFVLCMCFFPRLTMLFTGICFMPWTGFWFAMGWLFVPRFTVAICAIVFYWGTNPVLCVLACLWALSGESAEKNFCVKCGKEIY